MGNDRAEQAAFVAKILIQAAARTTCLRNDHVQRGAFIAMLQEGVGGGIKQCLSATLAALAELLGHEESPVLSLNGIEQDTFRQ